MTPIACAYIRVSREKEDGVSPEQQKEKAELQAKLLGLDLVHVYQDLDISGRSDKRPAFQAMISDITEGKYTACLVYKLDRFCRNVKDFHHYAEILESNGCRLISISQNIDTSTPVGRLLRNILADFAQFESEMIGERIKDNKLANAKRGRWNGGHVPYGYRKEDKQFVVYEPEAEAIRLSFKWRAQGKGVLAIAKELDRLGYKPRRGSKWGDYWSEGSIKYMLKNRVYLGELVYSGETIPNVFPAIITQDLFDAAQKTSKLPNRSQGTTHLLSGLLYCSFCDVHGFQIQYHGRRRLRRYVCQTKRRKSFSDCPSCLLDADSIERRLVEEVFNLAANREGLERARMELVEEYKKRVKAIPASRPKLTKELDKVQRSIRELFQDYYDHRIISREQFISKNADLQQKEANLKARIEEIEQIDSQGEAIDINIQQLQTELVAITREWEYLTPEEKRTAIRLVVKHINVLQDSIEIDFFHFKIKVPPANQTRGTLTF